MYLQVFIVICLGGGSFAAYQAYVWPIAGVGAHVFCQIVGAMELLVAQVTLKLFGIFVFTCVPQPIVLEHELIAAVVARVRTLCIVRVQVGQIVTFTDKRLRTLCTFERLRRAILVRPVVLLQIPFGAKFLFTNVTFEHLAQCVRSYVKLEARLQHLFVAHWTRHQINFRPRQILFGM